LKFSVAVGVTRGSMVVTKEVAVSTSRRTPRIRNDRET
jgi:hypothetical protein